MIRPVIPLNSFSSETRGSRTDKRGKYSKNFIFISDRLLTEFGRLGSTLASCFDPDLAVNMKLFICPLFGELQRMSLCPPSEYFDQNGAHARNLALLSNNAPND